MVMHVVTELIYDLFPRYCFNSCTQRFIKSSENFQEEGTYTRESCPKNILLANLFGPRLAKIWEWQIKQTKG